jgi:hypothetical protein
LCRINEQDACYNNGGTCVTECVGDTEVETDNDQKETGYCRITECGERGAIEGCGENCVKYVMARLSFFFLCYLF